MVESSPVVVVGWAVVVVLPHEKVELVLEELLDEDEVVEVMEVVVVLVTSMKLNLWAETPLEIARAAAANLVKAIVSDERV
jgi:hypothetical protein